jgi:autotransporter translocation and assembly factor TamB
VDGYVQHNGEEIIYLNGLYQADDIGNESITGDLELQRFPLAVINPFVPDKMVEFTGDIDGTLSMTGSPSKPVLNGALKLDSVNMMMPDLSVGSDLMTSRCVWTIAV